MLTTPDKVNLRCYFLRATAPSPPSTPRSENADDQLDTQISNEALETPHAENSESKPNTPASDEAQNTIIQEENVNQPATQVPHEAQDTPQTEENPTVTQACNEVQDTPRAENIENQLNEEVCIDAQDIASSSWILIVKSQVFSLCNSHSVPWECNEYRRLYSFCCIGALQRL